MAAGDSRTERENKKFVDFGNFVALNVRNILDVAMIEERIENNASGDPIYQGWAVIGSAETEAVWLISQLNYDANGNVIARVWAEGEDTFDKIWDNRATFNYSY